MGIDLIAALGGLVIPPVFDFIKKKFIKTENDTVERTIGALATTKPEVLEGYINALTGSKKADIEFFNRDVIGVPSGWVVDLRASIRPVTVVLGMALLGLHVVGVGFELDPGTRAFIEVNISSWFGARLSS